MRMDGEMACGKQDECEERWSVWADKMNWKLIPKTYINILWLIKRYHSYLYYNVAMTFILNNNNNNNISKLCAYKRHGRLTAH